MIVAQNLLGRRCRLLDDRDGEIVAVVDDSVQIRVWLRIEVTADTVEIPLSRVRLYPRDAQESR